MSNWKTNLGGAIGMIGTGLIGIGVLGGANPKYQAVCWWIALIGFVISAFGKGLTALFAADAATVQNVASAVDHINQLGASPLAAPLATKPPDVPASPTKI
jgi:hypothetical protein